VPPRPYILAKQGCFPISLVRATFSNSIRCEQRHFASFYFVPIILNKRLFRLPQYYSLLGDIPERSSSVRRSGLISQWPPSLAGWNKACFCSPSRLCGQPVMPRAPSPRIPPLLSPPSCALCVVLFLVVGPEAPALCIICLLHVTTWHLPSTYL